MKSDPRLVISTNAAGTALKLSGQDLHKLKNRRKNLVHPGVMGYFITFRCYGTWLHGDQRGSIDWRHRAHQSPLLERDEERERKEFKALKHSPVLLDERRRMIVDSAIRSLTVAVPIPSEPTELQKTFWVVLFSTATVRERLPVSLQTKKPIRQAGWG